MSRRKVIVECEYARVLYGLVDDAYYSINEAFLKYGKVLGVSLRVFYSIVREGILLGLFNEINTASITIIKKVMNE